MIVTGTTSKDFRILGIGSPQPAHTHGLRGTT
jgi:hypothetical protein